MPPKTRRDKKQAALSAESGSIFICDYLNESLYSLVSSSASAETIIET